jgi:hypothetical protein
VIPRDEYGDPIPARDIGDERDSTDADRHSVRRHSSVRMVRATGSAAQAQESWVEWLRREGP